MWKTTVKLSISFALLLNTAIFVFFFEEYVYLLDDILIPILFVYFFIDSLSVIIPKLNKDLFCLAFNTKELSKKDSTRPHLLSSSNINFLLFPD